MFVLSFQVVSCSKCRYQYELFSGEITSIESEEVRFVSCVLSLSCSEISYQCKAIIMFLYMYSSAVCNGTWIMNAAGRSSKFISLGSLF
jgi:hypothetical protein